MNDTVKDVNQAIEYEMRQWEDLRSSSEDNYNYARGNGWVRDEKKKAALEKAGIRPFNLNLILPILTSILGNQINHRYDLKAYPYDQTPQATADIITKILKRTAIRSELVHHLSMATFDALVANIGGYLAIEWTNEDDPFGEFKIFRESPFYHLRDSSNELYDINKGNHHIRTKWLDEDDLKASYPDRIKEIENFLNHKQEKSHWTDYVSNAWQKITGSKEPSRMDYINDKDHRFRVVELWEMQRKNKRVLINLNNPKNMIELPNGKSEKMARELIKGRSSLWDITTLKTKELRVKTVLGGVETLVDNELYDVQNGMFPFVNLFSYWFDGEPLSNVENLKDYQDEHNKRSTNMLQILNSTANSGWWVRKMGDGKLATDFENLTVNGSTIGFVGTYQGSKPPEKIQPNTLPSGHAYLDDQTRRGIRETSGIGENMRGGKESANESGKLFNQRVQQSEIALEPVLENIRLSMRILGDYQVKAIPLKMTDQRIIEFVDKENVSVERQQINIDAASMIKDGKFKVKLSEVNDSPTARTHRFMEIMGMAQTMPPEIVPWHIVIRNAPYEDKDEMADYVEQKMGLAEEQNKENNAMNQVEKMVSMGTQMTQAANKKVLDEEKRINK